MTLKSQKDAEAAPPGVRRRPFGLKVFIEIDSCRTEPMARWGRGGAQTQQDSIVQYSWQMDTSSRAVSE